MKAIVWTKYGSPDSLQLREVATPIPKDNEVLIKVRLHSLRPGVAASYVEQQVVTLLVADAAVEPG